MMKLGQSLMIALGALTISLVWQAAYLYNHRRSVLKSQRSIAERIFAMNKRTARRNFRVPRWGGDSPKAKVLILSAILDGERAETKDEIDHKQWMVSENHRRYADRHGYTYQLITKPQYYQITESTMLIPKPFQKVAHIYHSIIEEMRQKENGKHEFDLIMWIDNDALFMDCDQTVENLYRQSHEFYAREFARETESDQFRDMVVTGDRGASINSGVIIIKPSEWTKRVFSDWYAYSMSWMRIKINSIKQSQMDQPLLQMILHGLKPEHLIDTHEDHHDDDDDREGIESLTLTKTQMQVTQNVLDHWDSMSVSEKIDILQSMNDNQSMNDRWVQIWREREEHLDRPGCSDIQAKYIWAKVWSEESKKHSLVIPQRWMNAKWMTPDVKVADQYFEYSQCGFHSGDWIAKMTRNDDERDGGDEQNEILARINQQSTCVE